MNYKHVTKGEKNKNFMSDNLQKAETDKKTQIKKKDLETLLRVKNTRHYFFAMVLYPENRTHEYFIRQILPFLNLNIVGILHNRDLQPKGAKTKKGDELNEVKDLMKFDQIQETEYKKPHYHFVIKLTTAKTEQAMQNLISEYGIENRFIQATNEYVMIPYLTHKGFPTKFQYKETELFGNIALYNQYSANSEEMTFQKFRYAFENVIQYYNEIQKMPEYTEIIDYMVSQGFAYLVLNKYAYQRYIEMYIRQHVFINTK